MGNLGILQETATKLNINVFLVENPATKVPNAQKKWACMEGITVDMEGTGITRGTILKEVTIVTCRGTVSVVEKSDTTPESVPIKEVEEGEETGMGATEDLIRGIITMEDLGTIKEGTIIKGKGPVRLR